MADLKQREHGAVAGAGTGAIGALPSPRRAAAAPRALRPVIVSLPGRTPDRSAAVSDRLQRLRAVVLLDGAVRRGGLAEAAGRSLLDLPIVGGRTLLDLWSGEVEELSRRLAEARGSEGRGSEERGERGRVRGIAWRILIGRGTRQPAARAATSTIRMSIEVDPGDLRGTGGVLRDAAAGYADDDLLLVANAAQVLVEPLHELAAQAGRRGGDVTVLGNVDGAPASLMLVSCRALRVLPTIGFVDLKEQGLPMIAARYEVSVLNRAPTAGLPIRTPGDYLAALRARHRLDCGRSVCPAPFDERWDSAFAVVEPGAKVAADAVIHNSVVLAGARVDGGAVVADSVVCAGGVVRRREHVVRRLIHQGRQVAMD
jgi:hypothetical protein